MSQKQQALEHAKLALRLAIAQRKNAELRGDAAAYAKLTTELEKARDSFNKAFDESLAEANCTLSQFATKFNRAEARDAEIEAEKTARDTERKRLIKALVAARTLKARLQEKANG